MINPMGQLPKTLKMNPGREIHIQKGKQKEVREA